MKHFFKQESLQEIVNYNQRLLMVCILLGATSLLLAIKSFSSKEKWVLIPATTPDKKLLVSSRGYSEVYLQEWSMYVMQTLMTTSSDTVDRQVDELAVLSGSGVDLAKFFSKHREFVKGSNIQSVFFPKKVEVFDGSVLVSGLFRYWLGTSDKPVSQERTYRLTYKRGSRDILLLKDVVEVKS
jgi:conjugal transfer pilus assembly protein TraE